MQNLQARAVAGLIRNSAFFNLHSSLENGGSPRIRTEFSPVKSRDFTVKVCNPNAIPPCGTELNHRGQICEVLIDTGISHRGKKNPKRTESEVRPGPARWPCASTFDHAAPLPTNPIHLGNGRA